MIPIAPERNDGRLRVVVPLLEDCPLFELAVACEVFGSPRVGPDPRWYDLTVCRTVPGPSAAPEDCSWASSTT
ncbi:hypothetical protein [Nocardiopsis quinghaiensis]|uniref:hypothetical protein n=1 Tax=Nocardiopsis quinghaiensis TaxID=464995 RepID=UPI00123A9333|nr:hypothetical protein [Nocardiopsis quinghaiensis]